VRDTPGAMSEENVQVVRRSWEGSLAADWPAVLATLDPKAEIRDFDVPDADVGRGHDGFFAWLERWNDAWGSWSVEDLEIRGVGDDRAIALFRMIARGDHSGLELERRDAIVYRLDGGRIVYLAYYNDQDQAFEALRRAA
jgi:ketosteroid isomerase-like protein